jgi:hypothetical protein
MNKLTNFHAVRRTFPGVIRVPASSGLTTVGSQPRRRAIVCAWTREPLSGRLVCSWSHAKDQQSAAEADDLIASEIPLAA